METKNNRTQPVEETLLPHDEDFEKKILGILIAYKDAFYEVEKYLTPDTFYNPKHREIYKTMLELIEKDGRFNYTTLCYRLKQDNSFTREDEMYLLNLYSSVSSVVYAKYYAEVLRNLRIRRQLYEHCYHTMNLATKLNVDIVDTVGYITEQITKLLSTQKSVSITANQAAKDYYEHLEQRNNSMNTPISTGLQGLDNYLDGGFWKSNLIVFGGRPSMGKTALALFFTVQAAQQGKKVLYVNIEMTTDSLVERCNSKGLNYKHLRNRTLSNEEHLILTNNLSEFMNLPITITENVNTFPAILAEARKQKLKNGLDFLVVDYLQLINNSQQFERRQLEIAYMTRTLKALSKELDIPILLLAQLNRASKGQEKEIPRLESLRESGDIEQDADIVMFCHRPDQVNIDIMPHDDKGKSWYRRGIIFIAKNREGERNVEVRFAHDPSFKQFCDDGLEPPEWGCGTEKQTYNPIRRNPPNHDDITAF